MSSLIDGVKKNYKNIILLLVVLVSLPLITTIIEIIFTYGTIVGTYARTILETSCL